MAKFKKRPVEIEAVRFTGENLQECVDFLYPKPGDVCAVEPTEIRITTLEGTMKADVGDWIIKGVKGEYYPCKPDIFEATYELIIG